MKAPLYSQAGDKLKEIELSKEIFEVPFNKDLVHQALVYQLTNARQVSGHTKTKGEVSGRNMKPYKQKHTGRARQGSLRNPHMRGGGIVFGPNSERNFKLKMPKKQRRKALCCALSEKARELKVLILEKYEAEPKTKLFAELLKKLDIKKDILIVAETKDKAIYMPTKNLKNAKTILVNYLNIQDLQRFDTILFLESALKKLENERNN